MHTRATLLHSGFLFLVSILILRTYNAFELSRKPYTTTHSTAMSAFETVADLSNCTVGFLGCGKISSAVCRGYAGAEGNQRPKKINVSRRSAEKSKALQEEYPDLITVVDSNEELVAGSDIVFVGLLPGIARDILPTLPFTKSHIVISMMAAVDYDELVSLVKLPRIQVGKTVPLPAASRRSGPVLLYPPNDVIESTLRVVGKPIVCKEELEMKPMISLTGHISSFFELLRVTQDWTIGQGVDADTAKEFVSSFYSSCAQAASTSEDSFAHMAEEAATPGGLNEQSFKFLTSTAHYDLQEESLAQIHDRLLGKKPK
jgi:pyrroline-5-carboxylate reductase